MCNAIGCFKLLILVFESLLFLETVFSLFAALLRCEFDLFEELGLVSVN